jgi:hypothetical protein
MGRVTAIFDNESAAEHATSELRRAGVLDTHLSFVSRHGGDIDGKDTGENAAGGAGIGALTGAGVGALFGLAAAMIPGVGPFITAGALASTLGATAGTAAAGAVVGGATGAVAGALAGAGYSREEADYYGQAVERGSVMVAVDTDGVISEERARSILTREGGRSYSW